jgi:hypothetical protein
MKTINEVLTKQNIIKDFRQDPKDKSFWFIEKTKDNKFCFQYWIYTRGIADFILKNMKKRGDTIPDKHYEWRHLQDFRTYKQALLEFNKH